MIGNILEIRFDNFGMVVPGNAEGRMGSVTGYEEPIA
jgi:hypothetical protein